MLDVLDRSALRIALGVLLVALPAGGSAQTGPAVLHAPITMNVDLGRVTDGNGLDVRFTAQGSGLPGPQTANHGINVSCTKTGFWTATTTGEIDCINAVIRQAGPGDSSGLQIDTENLEQGFLAVQESVAASVNRATNRVTHQIDIQEGVVNRGTDTYGFVAINKTGQENAHFLGQTTGNSHASYLLRGIDNGTEYYRADGQGDTSQAGTEYVAGLATLRSARVVSQPVRPTGTAYVVAASDCGTTLRDGAAGAHTYTIPEGLPVGCSVHVIQAGSGGITFAGSGVSIEEMASLGSGHATARRFADAEILIDSAGTALLRGDVR